MKVDELGSEKQRRPAEEATSWRDGGGEESIGGKERSMLHQELRAVLKRGHLWRNCGWERRMKEEKGGDGERERREMK